MLLSQIGSSTPIPGGGLAVVLLASNRPHAHEPGSTDGGVGRLGGMPRPPGCTQACGSSCFQLSPAVQPRVSLSECACPGALLARSRDHTLLRLPIAESPHRQRSRL